LINLGFTTEGRLATVIIIPSSWGSQRAVTTRHQDLDTEKDFKKYFLLFLGKSIAVDP
jgi:hypothetical protein